MRSVFLHFALLFCSAAIFAQQKPLILSGHDRYKQASGRYGSNEGICLFEDSTFMLYGYATAVFGRYHFDKDFLQFYPDEPELFEVYAMQNKSIGKQTRINFVNFEGNGRSYLQLDKAKPLQVFNDEANCFDAPFVAEEEQTPQSFTLSAEESDYRPPLAANTYRYDNSEQYNDFIFVYHPPAKEYQPFSASFYQSDAQQIVLKLSNYGGDGGYRKSEADEDEQKQWREILEMKTQYDAAKTTIKQGILANEHYHTFLRDMKSYAFKPDENLYVSKTAKDNEDYFQQHPYDDDRYLRRYVLVLPKAKSKINTAKIAKDKASIFFTVCGEGAEKSYKYKALEVITDTNNDTVPLLETTVPVPLDTR